VLQSDTTQALAALPGGFATRRKGRGLEAADIREYQAGDDIRTLDRGATARTGRLHVREFQEERDRLSLLIADFRPSMFWGVKRAFRSVSAAEVLSLIGWQVVETGGRVGLLAITGGGFVAVSPRPRVRGMLDVIRGMVDAHATGVQALLEGRRESPTLDFALSRAERLSPPGSELFLASGFDRPGAELSERLNVLARRRAVTPFVITAAADLPQGSYPIRLEDGQRHRVRVASAMPSEHDWAQIGGFQAMVINAGDPVHSVQRRLARHFTSERAA